jgi:hypothetical protein
MTRYLMTLVSLVAITASASTSTASDGTLLKPGVVVEAVASKWFSSTADVKVGDVFLKWSCGKQIASSLNSPYDLFCAELRGAVCESIQLQGTRGVRPHVWVLGETDWEITVRPHFAGKLAALYLEGDALGKHGDADEAVNRWKKIADLVGPSKN